IRRICAGLGQAAGLPEDRLPIVTLTPESTGVTSNDPALTRRLTNAFTSWFGPDRLKRSAPVTGAEDFSEFAHTPDHVPICMGWVGAADPVKSAESERTGEALPSNHSAKFAPIPEPVLKTCVSSMTAAILELMNNKPN